MEIENSRGRIISGALPFGHGAAPVKKPLAAENDMSQNKVKRPARRPAPVRAFKAVGAAVSRNARRFAAIGVGAAVCAAGLGVLSTYCTVGVDYYCGDTKLCTVAAADDSAAIIGAAVQKAYRLGAKRPDIEVSAKLALRKNLVDGDSAVNAILAAAPGLCRGYTLSVDGRELFTAASAGEIDAALADYQAKYAMGGSARLSAEVQVEECITRKDELTPAGDMTALLENGGALTVISTVTETRTDAVPFEVTQTPDENMYVGDVQVDVPGEEGLNTSVVESVYSNGQFLSEAVVSTKTVIEPTTQVERTGTKLRNALEDGFSYPLSGRLSSGFGWRWGREHRGIDLAVAAGTPVGAGAAGTVITAQYNPSYGNYVQIDHGYGIVTTYAHMSSLAVSPGQWVDRGGLVGYSGSTGNSTGPHLHFEVIQNGNYLNPLDYLV